jgi:hypothetical protein
MFCFELYASIPRHGTYIAQATYQMNISHWKSLSNTDTLLFKKTFSGQIVFARDQKLNVFFELLAFYLNASIPRHGPGIAQAWSRYRPGMAQVSPRCYRPVLKTASVSVGTNIIEPEKQRTAQLHPRGTIYRPLKISPNS